MPVNRFLYFEDEKLNLVRVKQNACFFKASDLGAVVKNNTVDIVDNLVYN